MSFLRLIILLAVSVSGRVCYMLEFIMRILKIEKINLKLTGLDDDGILEV